MRDSCLQLGMRQSCNFVNVYTIRYRVHVNVTRDIRCTVSSRTIMQCDLSMWPFNNYVMVEGEGGGQLSATVCDSEGGLVVAYICMVKK